jgi:putative chitobiose transport system permease protein
MRGKAVMAEKVLTRRYLPIKVSKKVNRSIGGNVVLLLFIIIVAAFMFLPLLYIIVNAFKPIDEMFLFPPRFFVKNPTLSNFYTLIQVTQNSSVNISRYVFNSVFISGAGTFLSIFLSSLAAYPLAKHKFRGKSIYLSVIVIAILFRPEVMSIPQYIIVAKMGLIDTYLALLLPALGGTLGVFMMCQFMSTIPDAILEAAKIDGAGEYLIFFRIVMPQVKPAWMTLIIFTFQGFWNNASVSYIYSEQMKMLPTVLEQITAGGIARAGAGAATALLLLIPPITIYLICQGSIMETMSHSGIK